MYADMYKPLLMKTPYVSRVVKASNYDSLSFNYRDLGRIQMRFYKKGSKFHMDIIYNGTKWVGWFDYKPFTPKNTSLSEIMKAIDIVIDNKAEYYHRATKINE